MKWAVSIHPGVKDDIWETADYYAAIDAELAERFIIEARSASSFIRQYPNVGHILHGEYRRVVLKGFPYMLCYQIIGHLVIVIAIIHCSRDPEWVRSKLTSRT